MIRRLVVVCVCVRAGRLGEGCAVLHPVTSLPEHSVRIDGIRVVHAQGRGLEFTGTPLT